ncbi:Laminin subunit gamma-1, partial [Brachionus plicatilis]
MLFKCIAFIFLLNAFEVRGQESCYDHNNQPVRCFPEFINAVYNRPVEVTNTCGETPSEFCVQTNIHGTSWFDYTDRQGERCDICDNRRREKSHPPEYLTDRNLGENLTWWQSDTMEFDVQYPNSINLTLHLGKSFDITYIQVKFHSPRPESFAIYKKTNDSSDWIPYQFYSSNCEYTYTRPNRAIFTRENETSAGCTDEFSDIAPLSGGSVAFSTLEGRPNAYDFENNQDLKEWVSATAIKITLNRLNTFGDELFGDPKVLRSYYYAISDISVGGRCKCNGHADNCFTYQDQDFEEKYKCDCKHNTDGVDCEKCLPFFNDRPWAPATLLDGNECVACDCNGLSDKCVFNNTLFDLTGHGGQCYDCKQNTDGAHCEYCKFGFYRSQQDNECIDCQCHPEGSVSLQCNPDGQCACKPGVVGDKCDRCAPNHYDLTQDGCKLCMCDLAGSFDSPPVCDPRDGKCRCKQNVEGQNCDKCKPGFYGKDANLTLGCLPCFCFGHSSDCVKATNYVPYSIESKYELNNLENWTAIDSDGNLVFVGLDEKNKAIFVNPKDRDFWFNAPSQYLGNQRLSYNQDIKVGLKFQIGKSGLSRKDLIIENAYNHLQIYQTIYDSALLNVQTQTTDPMEIIEHEFSLRLKETEGWRPSLSHKDFHRLLSNISSIRVKANSGGYTFLQSFILQSARKSAKNTNSIQAKWIEQCSCPVGHTGQFCENCSPGYRREIQFGNSFVKCVPCSCNNHSVSCDQWSGKCECLHQTTGENCEKCRDGYYGNALLGTSNDCRKCPCPNEGPCVEFYNYQSSTNEVVCLKCPTGTKGNLCDICDDGFYEQERSSNKLVCEKCTCNSNIDENAVGNCDTSGKCLRCIYNTTGDNCDKCLPSYWGNALTDLKCHACECNAKGSEHDDCDLDNGQCKCRPNVIGRQCDRCKETFWNIESAEGCQECKCNPLGSLSLDCDQTSGKCECRPGVQGLKCDECMPYHFGFSSLGCNKCDCDPFGSQHLQCNQLGQCTCKPNIAGAKCDQCQENFFNFSIGCQPCDDCYNLVQSAVTDLRQGIVLLEKSLAQIIPDSMSEESAHKNKELQENLDILKNKLNDFHYNYYEKFNLGSSYDEAVAKFVTTMDNLNGEFKTLLKPYDLFEKNAGAWENLKDKIKKLQDSIELQLTLRSISLQQLEADNVIEKSKEMLATQSEYDAKLAELARASRVASAEQEKLAKDLKATTQNFLNGSAKAIQDIQDLLEKFVNIQTEPEADFYFLAQTSQFLAQEAENVGNKINQDVEKLNELNERLNNFKLNESEYEKNVLTEEDYTNFRTS